MNKFQDILEKIIRSDEQIKNKISNETFAYSLYGSLCNIIWEHKIHGEVIFTWRDAGEIVSDLSLVEGDYMAFYCSGYEGIINEEVKEILRKYDWIPRKCE